MPVSENYYDNLSDIMLSDLVGNTIMGIDFQDRIENRVSYATDFMACQRAIEVFEKHEPVDFSFYAEYHGQSWWIKITFYGKRDYKQIVMVQGTNPARAACIAMLKAKEKGNVDG